MQTVLASQTQTHKETEILQLNIKLVDCSLCNNFFIIAGSLGAWKFSVTVIFYMASVYVVFFISLFGLEGL
jgi:hypothetical protein